MKYIFLVPDGMADLPLTELDGQTPMQAARTPNFDRLAETAVIGSVLTVPDGMYPGSDAANMSLLGFDPRRYYTGRGPIEAAAIGVPMDVHDVAFRCSLVYSDGDRMLDYSSGHITTEEAAPLIELVSKKLGTRQNNFYPGVSYRHIMVRRNGSINLATTPPHDITGKELSDYWPQGDDDDLLQQMMYDSMELLHNHPVNRKRVEEGKSPANMIWLWGQGFAPSLPSFFSTFGLQGSVITAVDVVRGLARATSMNVVEVPGATGFIDTNYLGKGQYAVNSLQSNDFVFVHVESPDESGHLGNIEYKIRSIEDIDQKVLGPIIESMAKIQDFRVLIAPDHKTPISLKSHESGPVPFLLYDSTKPNRGRKIPFDERAITESSVHVEDGTRLIRMLLQQA